MQDGVEPLASSVRSRTLICTSIVGIVFVVMGLTVALRRHGTTIRFSSSSSIVSPKPGAELIAFLKESGCVVITSAMVNLQQLGFSDALAWRRATRTGKFVPRPISPSQVPDVAFFREDPTTCVACATEPPPTRTFPSMYFGNKTGPSRAMWTTGGMAFASVREV